jgi:hypothetical protein
MSFLNFLYRLLTGRCLRHAPYLEDLAGGTLFEVCRHCPWVGRKLVDEVTE